MGPESHVSEYENIGNNIIHSSLVCSEVNKGSLKINEREDKWSIKENDSPLVDL